MLEKKISEIWHLEQTTRLDKLTIEEGGAITAPEGKFVTMTINGNGCAIKPGTYYGDIILTVADTYHMAPHGLMKAMVFLQILQCVPLRSCEQHRNG